VTAESPPPSEDPGPDEARVEEPVSLPRVAIVGRPNVGKSTLLNALARSRIAIVEPTPGVTRDRVAVLCTLADRTVEVVDTGGIGIVDRQGLEDLVEGQVAAALAGADVVLFLVDAREGRTLLDERVAGLLRERADDVILVANKVETDRVQWNLAEFESLGYGEPLTISAQERLRLEDLEERIGALLPEDRMTPLRMPPPEMKLAVVGRVNAGKSTFVNALLDDDRMIVSEVPGTTRDSVDVRFRRGGEALVVIDTAGIRKERRVHGSVEFYAQRRAEKAMRRADVTLLMLDASVDVGRLDRQIAGYALDHYHPVVVVANKWDICREAGLGTKEFLDYLEQALPGLPYAPIVFTNALAGRNVDKVIEVARRLHAQARTRVGTAEVNRVLERAYALRKPRPRHGRIGRIYYGSQVDVGPPAFALFVNEPGLFQPAYLRFLANRFREDLPMPEVPVRIFLKRRERSPSKFARDAR
jgi:GTP-binding protein